MGERIIDPDERGAWRRRLASGSLYLALWLVTVPALPLWLALAAAFDLLRGRHRMPGLRAAAFFAFYLACELGGLLLALGLRLLAAIRGDACHSSDIDRHYALQARWIELIQRGAFAIFGIREDVTVVGDASAGPVLVLVRHTSTADTILAGAYLHGRRGLRLRYVLKRELLWDPCLDLVGHRLPNVFVSRGASDAAELERVGALARDLGPRDGVLLYPEGTRFSEAKRARVIASLRARGEHERAARAEATPRVLPPKVGGFLALLDAAPDADVIVLAHTGFEGAAHFARFWAGGLLGATLRMRIERFPRGGVPADPAGRVAWLLDRWAEVDRWVAANEVPPVARRAPRGVA